MLCSKEWSTNCICHDVFNVTNCVNDSLFAVNVIDDIVG